MYMYNYLEEKEISILTLEQKDMFFGVDIENKVFYLEKEDWELSNHCFIDSLELLKLYSITFLEHLNKDLYYQEFEIKGLGIEYLDRPTIVNKSLNLWEQLQKQEDLLYILELYLDPMYKYLFNKSFKQIAITIDANRNIGR